MAALTTNYGFDVPTSSDLVKNGATAISTLGQDIDTFLFRPFTRNAILNGSQNVWQRGTSGTANSFVSGTAGCNADRWQNYLGGGAITVSRQATGDTTNLPDIQYCARVQRNSGSTTVGALYHSQTIETVNAIPYAGKQVTVSYYARKGANFSAASNILSAGLLSGTGTDQNVLSGFTGSATVASANATLTTTWQRFTFTGTVATNATELGLNFYYTTVGTAGAADYFEITGVMLEIGNQASPYCPATPTYATELAACQRYFLAFNTAAVSAFEMPLGMQATTTTSNHQIQLPVTMRTTPSVSQSAIGDWTVNNNINQPTLTSSVIFANRSSVEAITIQNTWSGAIGAVAGLVEMIANKTAARYYLSAEL